MAQRRERPPLKMADIVEKAYLSYREAGALVSRSGRTIRRWAEAGWLVVVRVSGTPLVLRMSLDELIKNAAADPDKYKKARKIQHSAEVAAVDCG